MTEPNEVRDEVDRMREEFATIYSESPTHLVEAPGRINLIGEHIDYCKLPVLPMAIERRVRLFLRPRDDAEVRVTSTAQDYALRTFALSEAIQRYPAGDWGNYVKAAAQVIVRHLAMGGAGGAGSKLPIRGLDILIDSDLPLAAGLSSSSALVIACALGLLAANGQELPALDAPGPDGAKSQRIRSHFAGELARGERYVGTAGGGMDQTVCLLARAGAALRIEFEPFRAVPVPIPAEWRFVVAHSLTRAEKSKSALTIYNQRARQCREAQEAVTDTLTRSGSSGGYPDLVAQYDTHELMVAAEDSLHPMFMRRFRHVITEAQRVEEAGAALEAGDAVRFGDLMNASHASLRDDFEVSTPELDELVQIMLEAGAAGARLTGAGLGGCAIGVCLRDQVEPVCDALRDRFYGRHYAPGEVTEYPFVAHPSAGASVTRL
jgi:galactokinase